MKTSPARIRQRFAAQRANTGTVITLSWLEYAGGTVDPVTGARIGGTSVVHTEMVTALIHQVSGASALRQHVEVAVGDVIADLPHDVALDGKAGLQFLIDGRIYRQKQISGKLAQAWDVLVRGQRIDRAVLLELAG